MKSSNNNSIITNGSGIGGVGSVVGGNRRRRKRLLFPDWVSRTSSFLWIVLLPAAATVTADVWFFGWQTGRQDDAANDWDAGDDEEGIDHFEEDMGVIGGGGGGRSGRILFVVNILGAFLDGFFQAWESSSSFGNHSTFTTTATAAAAAAALQATASDIRSFFLSTFTSWAGMIRTAAYIAHIRSSVFMGFIYMILSVTCAFVAHGLGNECSKQLLSFDSLTNNNILLSYSNATNHNNNNTTNNAINVNNNNNAANANNVNNVNNNNNKNKKAYKLLEQRFILILIVYIWISIVYTYISCIIFNHHHHHHHHHHRTTTSTTTTSSSSSSSSTQIANQIRNQLFLSILFSIGGAIMGNVLRRGIMKFMANRHSTIPNAQNPYLLVPVGTLLCNAIFGLLSLSYPIVKLNMLSRTLREITTTTTTTATTIINNNNTTTQLQLYLLRAFSDNFCGAATSFAGHAADNIKLYHTKIPRSRALLLSSNTHKSNSIQAKFKRVIFNMTINLLFAFMIFWIALELENLLSSQDYYTSIDNKYDVINDIGIVLGKGGGGGGIGGMGDNDGVGGNHP